VTPNVTTIEFCYQTASFTTGNCAGALVAATPATASGTSPTTEGTTLSGLADATTYYVELEATNSLGTVTYGGVVSFTNRHHRGLHRVRHLDHQDRSHPARHRQRQQ